ncbi:recombinase family protein [Nonomuraea sp. NPDC052116]|uniref:recombinase family protein n=1 Tax=Nonomuraea sp. NPDC052116 TaxID=3155665 RepID=UPI00341F69D9
MSDLADPAVAVEAFECPTRQAPAGSACRTRGGKVAPKYHTPRFMLVPQLRAELEVRTPVDRGPGRPWAAGPERQSADADIAAGARPTRIGYARCSTAQQELQSQLDALCQAGCEPIFSEKISTRVKARPEFTKAMDFARTIKTAVPHQRVIFTVHEMKRLGRGAAELLTIAGGPISSWSCSPARCRVCTTRAGTGPRCSRSSPGWPSPSGSTSGRSRWRCGVRKLSRRS